MMKQQKGMPDAFAVHETKLCLQHFIMKTSRKEDHLADLEIDERLILKFLILRMGPIPGYSEKCCEPSCSANGRKSLD
jgi:hypothetical protein